MGYLRTHTKLLHLAQYIFSFLFLWGFFYVLAWHAYISYNFSVRLDLSVLLKGIFAVGFHDTVAVKTVKNVFFFD